MDMDIRSIQGKTFKVMNVNLHSPSLPPERTRLPEMKKPAANPPMTRYIEPQSANAPPEDTVDLNTENSNYTPYLKRIKRKIDYTWRYPKLSFESGEEGTTIVKFSINQDGALVAGNIISSSGAKLLDQGVLDAIQSAAPYGPMPRNIQLSRLNIIATFHYKLSK